MNWKSFIDPLTGWMLHSGLRILLVIAAAFIVGRLINTALKRFENVLTSQEYVQENRKRVHTLVGILRKIVKVSAFVVAVIIILDELEIDIRPIITAAGDWRPGPWLRCPEPVQGCNQRIFYASGKPDQDR